MPGYRLGFLLSSLAATVVAGCSGDRGPASGTAETGGSSGANFGNATAGTVGTGGLGGTGAVATPRGGTSSGSFAAGGTPTGAGGVPPSSAGTPSAVGSGGAPAAGGVPGTGGAQGGGAVGAAGATTGVAGSTSAGGAAGAPGCGSAASNTTPFGCKFAWGTNEPQGAPSSYGYLDFLSKWVGYEIAADGTFKSCDGCTWLSTLSQTTLVPVYYAYFIGYLGHANGLPDGNQNPNGPNLTTDAALLIRKQRANLVGAYAEYARRSHDAWPTRPLVWLLEGDFVQYTDSTQKQALSYAELGQLGADIACAIKSNMPNAVVAINQSTWNADQVTMDFWSAMKAAKVAYDLVWTTGVANNAGFFDANTNASSYNHTTATYAYVHGLTGKPIFVDTSFGLSAMADSWSGAQASDINARIADGVLAANVTSPDGSYASRLGALRPSLGMVCK